MATWNAINVEPEDDLAVEIDDTKEIQLEEAFKLYQNALKLHSQGPSYYEDAKEAYEELFRSEVFKYPEAASAFDQDLLEEPTSALAPAADVPVLALPIGGASENANSLPQLVYLACKSRAQFEIDVSHALVDQLSTKDRSQILAHYEPACRQSLIRSAAALERDDTDLDLWKRSSRVSDVLHTVRILRFCLESVLAGDEEGDESIDLSGLDEVYAKGELQDVLELLQDTLTVQRTSDLRPKPNLMNFLRQSNDPYPFLPTKALELEYIDDRKRPLTFTVGEAHLTITSTTYLAVTQALDKLLSAHEAQFPDVGIGAYVKVVLPPAVKDGDVDAMAEQDIDGGEFLEVEVDGESPASFHSVPDRAESAPQSPKMVAEEHPKYDTLAKPKSDEDESEHNVALNVELVSLPSRKRSSTVAGNEEPEARAKSKRIKARESMAGTVAQEEELPQDPFFMYRDQFAAIETADDLTFKFVNSVLDKIGAEGLGSLEALREGQYEESSENVSGNENSTSNTESPASQLKHALKTWNEEKSGAFASGHGNRDHVERSTGLSLFLKHSKASIAKDAVIQAVDNEALIRSFAESVNHQTNGVNQVLFLWLSELLTQKFTDDSISSYLQGSWMPELKQAVVELLVHAHERIVLAFERVATSSVMLGASADLQSDKPISATFQITEFAQTMFEIHLDVYSEITNPASTVAEDARKLQMQRLQTWSQKATDMMQFSVNQPGQTTDRWQQVVIRFLWSSIIFAKLCGSVEKSHVLLCLEDLKDILESHGSTEIILPNNAAMPIISQEAIKQEMSRVKTLDFFMSVFDSDNSEPLSVIMKLEPILEYKDNPLDNTDTHEEREQIQNFRAFLNSGDASLTLFLWKRLQNAYTAISYNTKVVSCLFRSVETITKEIASMHGRDLEATEREISLLRWLRDIDELITKLLAKIADDKSSFECIDEDHLKSSISAIVYTIRLGFEFVLRDDCLRVGFIMPPPHRNATASKNFEKSRDRFREMNVKLWTLLYLMIKEATVQMSEHFEDASQDLVMLIRCMHASLGERQFCKYCNKMFVRIAKTELFTLSTNEDLSVDIAQIIYDLYQIKLSTGYGDSDHGCSAETLEKDKRTAHILVPIIMDFVKRLNVKDLLRSDLKATIDRIQSALGQAKPSTALSFNRRAVSGYLKSLINPQRLYQALRGIGELETKVVHGDFASIAAQGWYLLLGNMTLAKYKSVKRVNPTPTDDLDNALTSLRQDIEHDATNWESWYRLAQVHDAKIEDNLIWNSNKLNDGRSELATLERNAVNAYTMATALGMRLADDDIVTTRLINDMFFDFATRLYSSSRPPLDMDAFSTDKTIRHLSSYYDQAMSKQALYRPMTEYNVWSFAAHLIQRSLSGESKPWLRYYILGKCQWKMFNHSSNKTAKKPIDIDDVIDTFTEAVNRVPKKERSADPILEPHFKLVSVIHKLQDKKLISVHDAVQYMQATAYARSVSISEDEQGNPEWESYVLAVLKKLQIADKSGWHHRITARAAHVIFNAEGEIQGALGAKHQFVDSIFTKSMIMQVWKPENERAGRHYVYTGRYLRFFIKVLDKLRDRSNLEQVVRKIRRKTTDFISHSKVWEEAVTTYVDLLRSSGNIPRDRERALFDSISFDEFSRQSEKLEQWAHDPQTTTTYLDTIKDAIEMKKLNNSLMKSPAIDDLIGDAYACMYDLFVSQLPPEEQAPPPKPVPAQGTFINLTAETAPTGDDNLDRMRLNNLLSGQVDGASPAVEEHAAPVDGLRIITKGIEAAETPPPEAARVPAPAKPGRTKTITRREVQRKAEAAIGKPPPIKTPTLTKRSISVNIPSIKKENSEDRNEDEEGGADEHTNVPSDQSSRRGSISNEGSPNPDADDAEDEGGDGDNEEEEEEEDDDNEDRSSDSDADKRQPVRKRLFPGLTAANANAKDKKEHEDAEDDDDDEEDEEGDGEGEGDKMSDVKADHDDGDGDGPEIPDSQDPAGVGSRDKDGDGMETD